jgi:hypothetical protein
VRAATRWLEDRRAGRWFSKASLEQFQKLRVHTRMMHSRKLLLAALCLAAGLCASTPVSAQSDITLVSHVSSPPLEAEALRASVEAELQVPTTLRAQPSGPTLQVDAETLSAVRVSFVRQGKPTVERTLDVSTQAEQASSIVGLVAANLVRDEAGELLAQLSAASAKPPAPAEPAPRRVSLWAENACRKPNTLRHVPIGVDFVPYVGTSISHGFRVERSFSLNIIGGITGGVRGVELGGVFNIDGSSMCGAQLAGTFNYVGGDVAGAQFGLLNITAGNVVGAQFAQLNLAGGDLLGAQLGLLDIVGGHLIGAQLGLANIAADGVGGLQYGLLNVSVGDTEGAQLGLVNVTTHRVNGAMVGLVNVAAEADAAVGLVNVIWNGRAQLDVWATDAGLIMVGAMPGAKYTHNIYGVGIKPMGDTPAFATALGIGVRPYSGSRLTVDIDVITYGLMRRDTAASTWDFATLNQLRVPVAFAPLPKIWVWVAPTLSVSVANVDSNLQKLALFGSQRLTSSDNTETAVRIWPGLSVGARFF